MNVDINTYPNIPEEDVSAPEVEIVEYFKLVVQFPCILQGQERHLWSYTWKRT